MSTGIVIFARLSSKRLKNKVIKKIGGKTLLEWIVHRLKLINLNYDIILATSINNSDDKLIELAKKIKIKFFRGSLNDVLNRACSCCKEYNLKNIVRICGDSPLIDPYLVEKLIEYKIDDLDVVTNVFPRTFPKGMSCEVISSEALYKADIMAKTKFSREHITNFFYQNSNQFKILNIKNDDNLDNKFNLAIDLIDDFMYLEKKYKDIGKKLFDMNIKQLSEVLIEQEET